MADYFTPITWNDGEEGGTAINAAKLTQIGDALEAIDNALDDVADQVAALTAVGSGVVPSGPSANRPFPLLGQQYFDTGLGSAGKLIVGTGSGWVEGDGTAVSGAGGSNAPQNFLGEVQPDNSIDFTWDAVASATSYKLYETESPTGVSGATALTGTSTTRTPSALRTYDYWLTATVGGVEGATSDHAIVSLPFGSVPGGGGGTGTGDTPAEILNINGVDGGTGGWWNLGIGFHPGDPEGAVHTDISPSTLANGYIRADYFYPNAANNGVIFKVYMDGAKTTSNTKYPRCEFREYKNSSTKASWSGSSGTHTMEGYTKVLHMAPQKQEICLAQIHDSSDDTLQIRMEGASGSADWVASINGTINGTNLVTNYTYGTEHKWKIELINGTLKIYIDDSLKITNSPSYGSGQYFKVGTYAQANTANGNSSSEYQSSELRGLVVTHSPAL